MLWWQVALLNRLLTVHSQGGEEVPEKRQYRGQVGKEAHPTPDLCDI